MKYLVNKLILFFSKIIDVQRNQLDIKVKIMQGEYLRPLSREVCKSLLEFVTAVRGGKNAA